MSVTWQMVHEYTDVLYEHAEGMAKITINRPEVRNAFRPETIVELMDAFAHARDDGSIGVVFLTGARPARRSAASTPATAPRTWPGSWGTRRRERSGISAVSTTPKRHWPWAW
jgi:hypothetical protein